MKNRDEIEKKLEELYCKRLKNRLKRCLKVSYLNCKYNKRYILEKNGIKTSIGICGCQDKLIDNKIVICDKDEIALKCEYYENKHTREKIEQQFVEDISNPQICGQKEPKIAVLLWILQGNEDNNTEIKKVKMKQQHKGLRLWHWLLSKINGFV